MGKLFEDKEVFQKERPLYLNNQQLRELCNRLAKELQAENYSTSKVSDISDDLFNHVDFNDDGYQIGKTLESLTCSASYKFNSMFVEHLDWFNSAKSDKLEGYVKEWVKAHDIKPEYDKGNELISFGAVSYAFKKGGTFFITGMRKETACYYINNNKDGNGGVVISFEKIESNCQKILENV